MDNRNAGRWRKLRRHPQKFLSDSSFGALRALGEMLRRHPAVERHVRELAYDPASRLEAFLPAAGARLRAARMDGAADIDVIVPFYNNAATIAAAIASLAAQTLRPARIIAIDDGSSDASAAIVESLARRDPAIHLHRLPRNGGVAAARNAGLSLSNASYVAFQDADDVSHPRRLELQLRRLRKSGAIAATCDGCRMAGGRIVEIDGHFYHELSVSLLFRRAGVIDRVGAFRTLTIGEDVDFLARIRAAFGDASVVHLRRCLYVASLRPGSAIYAHGEMREVAPLRYRYIPSAETARALADIAGRYRGGESAYIPFGAPPQAAPEAPRHD